MFFLNYKNHKPQNNQTVLLRLPGIGVFVASYSKTPEAFFTDSSVKYTPENYTCVLWMPIPDDNEPLIDAVVDLFLTEFLDFYGIE